MDFVTVQELLEESSETWRRLDAGEEFVITRNDKPFALLVGTEPEAVGELLQAVRRAQFGRVVRHIQAQSVANGTDRMTEEEIQTEIDAVRREQHAASPPAPEHAGPIRPQPKTDSAQLPHTL